MGDLNTTFVDLPSTTTPIDAAWLNAANKRMRSRLPVVDVVEDYGAKIDGATDDTAAWQNAINAVATAGGGRIICSKVGVSIIAGALVDTSGANCQIKLPSIDYVDTENITVEIVGAFPPPNVFSVIGTTPLPDNHLVLKSTLGTGSGGAMIGAYGPAGTFANFTNVTLRIVNVTFRMPANPAHSALDLRNVACADLENVIVDAGNYYADSIIQQTTSTSYGIRLPGNNNGAHVRLGQVDVIGFYNGFEFSEHTFGEYVAAWGCRRGFVAVAANHASRFTRLGAYHCQRGIVGTGTHRLDVGQYNIEHAPSGTWVTTYDVDDASNFLKGSATWAVVLGGTGIDSTFTKNSATNFNTAQIGTAPGGGGGSTIYVARDKLVASGGNNTLTLGATPVANSPLISVNATPKDPGVEYTISGNVVTFVPALSASDVVRVYYLTLSASAGASSLSTAGGIADNFNRANNASTLGSTSTGSVPWSNLHGATWGIISNGAYVAAGGTGSLGMCAADSGLADCTVQVTMANNPSSSQGGLYVRATDGNNGYIVEGGAPGGNARLYKLVAGTATQIGISAAAQHYTTGDVMTVVLSGTSITVKRNGTTIISVTDSTFTTQTKHGLYGVGSAVNLLFDDFSVSP